MKNDLPRVARPSLVLCLIMDAVGYASFALPALGEFTDVLWAPLSAYIFYKSFGGKKGAFGAIFNFAEEILPFTDFIPSFTIMWVYQYFTGFADGGQARSLTGTRR